MLMTILTKDFLFPNSLGSKSCKLLVPIISRYNKGLGIMGNDEGVHKTKYNTWLSSRLQNQPRSLACFAEVAGLALW